MKTKSKWKGAVLLTMALVLAFSLAVPLTHQKSQEAEALDLQWGVAEGVASLGLPVGAGAMIDVAVVPGTNTVFVLCDLGLGAGTVAVFRSDDGGLSWGAPLNLAATVPLPTLLGVAEVGVDIEVSPNYSQDGTVFVLTNDTGVGPPFVGRVYTSTSKGITWLAIAAPLTGITAPTAAGTILAPGGPTPANCLAIDPNFNSLLSGGTIVVGGVFDGVSGTSVWYETWQGPLLGWTGAWTAVPAQPGADTLALKYAPTSSIRLIAVMNDNGGPAPFAGIWGVTGSIITGFPALAVAMPAPGNNNGAVFIHQSPPGAALNGTTNAVIALGTDYDPVSTPACPNCPMYFFVGTSGVLGPGPANTVSSTFWFDPLTSPGTGLMVDLRAASIVPAIHWATSGLVARGMYNNAELIAGSALAPVTYTYDAGTMSWDTLVRIAGDGGPIGAASPPLGLFVGVKLAYMGSGNQVHAITGQVQATAYGAFLPATAGDLTCLSQSDDYGASWWDTCLTQEPFVTRVVDMAWTSAISGLIVCDDTALAPGRQSVFMSPMPTQWKRVDRWQGVQRITVSVDGAAIFLLDTGMTGGKVLRSVDGGNSFLHTAADPVAIVTIPMTAIAAGTANDIFVGDWNGHMYVSHDGGVTWTDSGQVASSIKSLALPKFYAVVKHVLAGVDTLVAGNQGTLVSKDDGATWSTAGIAVWGPGGNGPTGHIEVKFSPMYNGATENFAYAGLNLPTPGAGMYRADLSAFGVWTNMGIPVGPVPVSNFDIVHVPGIVGDAASNENILYVLDPVNVPITALIGWAPIYATYYPELVSRELPGLWRGDGVFPPVAAAGPVLWQANLALFPALNSMATWALDPVGTPGMTLIPCPFDVVVGAGSPGSVTLFARDNSGSLGAIGIADLVANITETTAFLSPIAMHSPANGAIVPSNNLATGEPVELQWPMTFGAAFYDVMVVTDITNPSTALIFAQTAIGLATEFSIVLGTLVDGQTYYWRVRVANTTPQAMGDQTGPFSAWHSFTIEAVDIHVAPTLLSPASGDVDVPQAAMFRWSVIEDVVSTDFQLANDGAFTDIIDEATLGAEQTYAYPGELSLSSTYHWRVRGHGGTGIDAWTTPWAEGIFTTIGPPPPQPTPIIIQEGDTVVISPDEDITPGWIWALIAIGGVLAVVVIVLIMRTRRPV